MKRSIAAARTACLLGLVLLAASGSARAQSAWAYSDVYYDAATDRVYGTTTTLVDYSTEYYYSPKVFVSLSGSDGSYSYWYRPVGGAGACTNGNYAFGDVSVAPTPGPRTPFRALILSISTTTTIKSTLDVPGVAVTGTTRSATARAPAAHRAKPTPTATAWKVGARRRGAIIGLLRLSRYWPTSQISTWEIPTSSWPPQFPPCKS